MHVCGHGCMHGHKHVTKWLMRAAIVIIFFMLGFMMGELHGMVRSFGHDGYRGQMMRGGDMMNWDSGTGAGMMGGTTMMKIVPPTGTTTPVALPAGAK